MVYKFFDTYSKHACVAPGIDKKVITFANAFPKLLDQSGQKPTKYY